MDKAPQNKTQPSYFVKLLLLVVMFIALAISTQWFDAKKYFFNTQHKMMSQIAEIDIFGTKSRNLMAGVHATKQKAEKRLYLLEEKITHSTNHHIEPTFPKGTLLHDAHEIAWADTERLVSIAAQHLNQADDVMTALNTMRNAAALIQNIDGEQATALRHTIKKDIEKLEAAPHIQTLAINSRLNLLTARIDTLPLTANSGLTDLTHFPTQKEDSIWLKLAYEILQDMKELIHIKKMSKPEAVLLAPSQIYFLRENLKLKLILTRFSLLSRDTPNFRKNLKAAINWTNKNFDKNSESVAKILHTLNQLYDDTAGIELPDVTASHDAILNYRLKRNKEKL